MSRVILHIGTHKTATTTIQDTLFHNADILAQANVIYPRLSAKITGHHGLVHDWGKLPEVYRLPAGSRAALADIARDHASSDRTVILSSEEFSRADPEAAPDFAELRKILAGFDKITVVCTLRTQWEFLQSVYQELSKKHRPPRPPQLVWPVIERGTFAGLFVDYGLLLDRLESSFGPSDIHLVDYHRAKCEPGGLVGHVLRLADVGYLVDRITPVNGGMSNVSPPSLSGWAANILAEPHIAPDWTITAAQEAYVQRFGPGARPCLFTSGEFDALARHFEARNTELEQRRTTHQPGFEISRADSSEIAVFRNHADAEFWMRVSRRLGTRLGLGPAEPSMQIG